MSEQLLQSALQGKSVYPILAAYLQGNLADMLFYDLRRSETVQVSLQRVRVSICCQELDCEDAVVRCDLTKDLRSTDTPSYLLLVEVERPLPQFTIEARLEAVYLPRWQG